MLKIVTANRLATGAVVFLSVDGEWVGDVGAACLFEDAEAAEEGLLVAQRDADRSIIVDPFVIDKGPDKNGTPGMTLRDRIRAFGPTIKYVQPDGEVA